MSTPAVLSVRTRTLKEDSALFYHLLEGHEGLVSVSTLEPSKGLPYRDVELLVAPTEFDDLMDLLKDWPFVTVLSVGTPIA